MVKKGALSGAIIIFAGAVLSSILIIQTLESSTVSVMDYLYYSSIEHFSQIVLMNMIFLAGILVFFMATIGTKKKSLFIGGIIYMIGLIGVYTSLFLGSGEDTNFQVVYYDELYQIMMFVLVIGSLIYYVGIIKHRSQFKIGLLTGLLIVLIGLANMVLGIFIIPGNYLTSTFIYNISSSGQEVLIIHLLMMMIQKLVLAINALAFSFSKVGEVDTEEDDELSVESGGAFASYVDDSAYSSSKKKPKKPSNDIEFEF